MASKSISASTRIPSQPLPTSPIAEVPAATESSTSPITVLETAPLPPWPTPKPTPDSERSRPGRKFTVVKTTMNTMAIPMINDQPLDYEPLFTPRLVQRLRGRTMIRRSDLLEAQALGIPIALNSPGSPTMTSAPPSTNLNPSMTSTHHKRSISRPASPSPTASEQECWERMSVGSA